MSRAFLDSLELPHWLILAGILLLITGITGLVIDRKKIGKVDEAPANEASSEARPQLPPLPDLLDSQPRKNGVKMQPMETRRQRRSANDRARGRAYGGY
jgi:hypothetical protein